MKKISILVCAIFLFVAQRDARAALANAWHIPDDSGDLGFNMRNPEFAIGTNTTVAFYTGVWKFNGATQLCNQTGGTLFYKTASQNSWSSTNLNFYSNNSGNGNQYWFASVNCAQFNFNDTVQYFFLLTFDGYGGVTNTFLYGTNSGSFTTGSSNSAAANPFSFAVTNVLAVPPVLTVNGLNADYTTEHLFVDEVAGDSIPVTISFSPNTNGVVEADVFSNLNRRNRATLDANGDGIEDGIVPPDGNSIATGDDNNYYKAYAMTDAGGGNYSLTLYATNCGAYRLTARYKVSGNTNWFWYDVNGVRDHAIVVSPAKARNMTLYELNAMNLNAQGTNFDQRGTFADLITNRFNLNYLQNLGVNWLWFQPIHPIGILNRLTDDNTGQPYSVGSPYSVKNFFQINPLLGKADTRAEAMVEFSNFVAAADAAGMNVMLDEPFNHTAWDCELDASGVNYFDTNAQPTDLISASEARFYSRTNEYDQRASSAATVAPAPDRYDFGKWTDVVDIYYGRYAALVGNSSQTGNYTSEADWFDYSVGDENSTGGGNGHFDQITQNVWRYFSDCILYWLDQTGCTNGTPASQTFRGIDGLRADFGQGLPPQCWEYIINKVRARKWDFVFMTESLDGGAVTYRSNRHFDVLNENAVFDFQTAATASDYRNIFDTRRNSYGQSLILWNSTSHDEESYADPFEALIRYLVGGTIDGVPMIFYGQELGISQNFGFDWYQLNFGKEIPHFMIYNSLQPILNPANRNFGLDQLNPVFAAVGQARQFSPALRSSNRYYLDQSNGSGPQPEIFSVAKYQTANGAPNFNDVVFAFVNLDRNDTQIGTFNVNITQNGSNLFGIKPARIYNVKNISAYVAADPNRRNYWQWGGGIAGSNVLANGVYVYLNPVPTTNAGWTNNPFEAQYLKLYDVTPPPAPSIGTTNNYVFTNVVTFTWSAVSDAEGGISGYHVLIGTAPGGSDVFNGIVSGTSLTVTNIFGAHLYATVTAVNNAGIESAASTNSGVALVNPAWVPLAHMAAPNFLSWSSVSGLTYQVLSTTNLSVPFTAFGGFVTASTPSLTFTNSATNAMRYYKIQLFP
jgi:glycosidase